MWGKATDFLKSRQRHKLITDTQDFSFLMTVIWKGVELDFSRERYKLKQHCLLYIDRYQHLGNMVCWPGSLEILPLGL